MRVASCKCAERRTPIGEACPKETVPGEKVKKMPDSSHESLTDSVTGSDPPLFSAIWLYHRTNKFGYIKGYQRMEPNNLGGLSRIEAESKILHSDNSVRWP